MIKSNFTYAQLEERITGPQDGFLRGDDFAIIASIEVTPFKGLDIRPIFSYANFISTTSSSARQARGGVGTGIANYPLMGGGFGDAVENRYTVGIDSRWRFGAFSLDPTVFYQFGKRDQVVALSFNNGLRNELKRDAWFFDIRGGWQAGPLLLELAGIYTTGNRAKDRIDRNASRLKFYEPLDTDTSFYATWAEIWALGIDYFNIFRSGATGLNPGVAIGYDKYGLIRAGVRGSYALTPAFTVRAAANSNWTTHDVDASSVLIAGTGLTQCSGLVSAAALNCDAQVRARDGNSQYLGTEVNLGFQWRFAPNVAFDMVAAYMFAGNALSTVSATNVTTGVTNNGRNPQDVQAVTARVRYSW